MSSNKFPLSNRHLVIQYLFDTRILMYPNAGSVRAWGVLVLTNGLIVAGSVVEWSSTARLSLKNQHDRDLGSPATRY